MENKVRKKLRNYLFFLSLSEYLKDSEERNALTFHCIFINLKYSDI